MKVLDKKTMSEVYGGGEENLIGSLCVGIAVGSSIAALVVATNWWNPSALAGGAILLADFACAAYGISTL